MEVPKPVLAEFGIHYRLESCGNFSSLILALTQNGHFREFIVGKTHLIFCLQDHQSKDASSHVSGPVLLESVTPGSGGDIRVGGEVGVNRQALLRLPSR